MNLAALFFLTTLQKTWVLSSRQRCITFYISQIIFFFLPDALQFDLSINNSRCYGSVCLGKSRHGYLMFGLQLLHRVIVSGIRIDKKVIILHFSEEGYDSGHSPEPLVNVTAVPLVSEILQVFTQFCEASYICHSCS